VALTTLSDLVQEVRERVERDALAAGLPDEDKLLRAAYAEAVEVFLSLAASKQTVFLVALARWRTGEGKSAPAFGRQGLPMVWDFADLNPFAGAGGDFLGIVEGAEKMLRNSPPPVRGNANQADAATQTFSTDRIVSTDPPYYDNIGYADLSDYFYVWLRRSLKAVFPELFATLVVPKAEELVATPYRHGSKEKAEAFFLDGMTQAMHRLAEQAHPAFPVTIYYAFKQAESDGDDGTSNTGKDLGDVVD
jgi:putative DNA methylase